MSISDRRTQWLDHAQAAARPDGDTPNAALLAELRTLNKSRLVRAPIGTIAVSIMIALFLSAIVSGLCAFGISLFSLHR